MDRRTFLIRTGGLIATLPPLSTLLSGCAVPLAEASAPAGIDAELWRTVLAVQEHLLPPEPGAPGAREIQAGIYLRGALTAPGFRASDRAFLVNGSETLGKLTREMAGRDFVELSGEAREQVLRRFEATPIGRRWLAEMLGYLMEALLGDPVYGGNPDGRGWRWLDHTAGFPRPTPDKRYYFL